MGEVGWELVSSGMKELGRAVLHAQVDAQLDACGATGAAGLTCDGSGEYENGNAKGNRVAGRRRGTRGR